MRVCHVSPHLPPDQAANALLPAELASWAHAHGHHVTLVAHEPAQGQAASPLPAGQVWRLPRKPRTGGVARALRIDTLKHARLIAAALDEAASGADLLHLHSNGLIIEVAAAWVATHMRKPKRATTGGSVGDPGISSHAVAAAPIGGEPSAVN